MNPDLVLCGGRIVYGVLKENLDLSMPKWACGFCHSYLQLGGREIAVVELYHPARYPHAKHSYEALKELKWEGVV